MPQNEVFSEQEASEILRRAAELMDRTDSESGGYRPGITRNELETVAKEIGVDARALAQAISERGGLKTRRGTLNLIEEYERVLEGELDPNEFDVLAKHIRPFSHMGHSGLTQIGRSMQASAWTGVSQAQITVSARNGRTKLHVRSNSFMAFMMGGYPALLGSILSAVGFSENGMVGVGLAAAAGFLLAGVGAVSSLIRRGHAAAEKLTDRLEGAIAEDIAAKAASELKLVETGDLKDRLENKA